MCKLIKQLTLSRSLLLEETWLLGLCVATCRTNNRQQKTGGPTYPLKVASTVESDTSGRFGATNHGAIDGYSNFTGA